jgi:hypothetical protein
MTSLNGKERWKKLYLFPEVSSRRSSDEESSDEDSLTSRRRPQDKSRPRPLISVISNTPSDLPDLEASDGEEEDNQATAVTPSNKDILTELGKISKRLAHLERKKRARSPDSPVTSPHYAVSLNSTTVANQDSAGRKPGDSSILSWDPDDRQGELGNTTNPKLIKVSDDTEKFIKEVFGHSISNGTRLQTRKEYPFPDLNESRCPKLDPIMKQNLSKDAKDVDTAASKVQALVLDSVAPLTSILEDAQNGSLTVQKTTEAAKAALTLLGNASAAISKERRKKIAKELNKDIVPLIEVEDIFEGAAPMLFGDGFESKVKDHVQSLKCLRKSMTFQGSSGTNFFRRGRTSYPARGGGNFRGRAGWQSRFQPFHAPQRKGKEFQKKGQQSARE